MGFIAPSVGRGRGLSSSGFPSHLPAAPGAGGGRSPPEGRSRSGGRERRPVPGEIRTARPQGRKGCRRAGRGAARKPERRPAGSRCRPAGDPSGNPPQGQGEGGGSREPEGGRTSAVLLREEVRAVVQAASCGVGGAQRAGGEDGAGETQGETLVPIPARPPAPARAPPPPPRALGSAPRTPTIISCSRREPAQARTAPRAVGSRRRRRRLQAGGASEQLRPAPPRPALPPLPPRRWGRGLRARKKGSGALRPTLAQPELSAQTRAHVSGDRSRLAVQTQEGPKATRGCPVPFS